MRSKLREIFWAALLCVAGATWLPQGEVARAQGVPTPSQDQLNIFQNLNPDQQDAILRQLGGSATGGTGGASGLGGTSGNVRQGTAAERDLEIEQLRALRRRTLTQIKRLQRLSQHSRRQVEIDVDDDPVFSP